MGQFKKEAWERAGSDRFGFSFYYPKGWIRVYGTEAMIFCAPNAASIYVDGIEVYSPALTLIMAPRGNTVGQTPEKVFSDTKNALPRFFPGCIIEKEDSFILQSGQKADEIYFEFLKGSRQFKSLYALIITRNAIFIFDGSCFALDFSTYQDIFQESIHSLSVTG